MQFVCPKVVESETCEFYSYFDIRINCFWCLYFKFAKFHLAFCCSVVQSVLNLVCSWPGPYGAAHPAYIICGIGIKRLEWCKIAPVVAEAELPHRFSTFTSGCRFLGIGLPMQTTQLGTQSKHVDVKSN